MIGRLRSLVRPEGAPPPREPSAAEAFAGWMLGTLCALLCLWLGDLGTHSLVPGVLLCGVLALIGWRHLEWLFWLPMVVVLATLAEPIAPLTTRGRFGAPVYVDVLMLGVMAVATIRALALRRRIIPRTPIDGLLLALCALGALSALPAGTRVANLLQFKPIAIAILVYYATAAVAGVPGGARWVWPAYPLTLALLGGHALWALGQGPGALAAQARAVDAAWGAHYGLLITLVVALPVSLGLAADAGDRAARRVWQAACLLGAAGIAAHALAGGLGPAPQLAISAVPGLAWALLALGAVILAMLARMAWTIAAVRPAETPRWVAVAFTCLALPLLPLMGLPVGGMTALLLAATAGGLIAGTRRALDRDARRAAAERAAAAETLAEAA